MAEASSKQVSLKGNRCRYSDGGVYETAGLGFIVHEVLLQGKQVCTSALSEL